ncbi:MAG: MBL fold metallo-hydrolase [Thermodesulfovibrionia bacterium]|nr:MBL fold metallo-hydrolase [Thermodesulfovibrionia bacterium]
MKLIILGSGTCVPSLKRNAPGYFLEAEGRQILIDCGSGTLLQLERAGKSYKDIDAVFITHLHPDHFSDLMPLIHALIATPKFKREKELLIAGQEGFKEYYENAFIPILRRREFIKLIEIKSELELEPVKIFSTETIHIGKSLAYRFESGGRSVVFTGDADYDQGLIDFSKDAGLLIADCSFPHSLKMKGHLSAKECGLVAQAAGVKRLILSHIYPSDVSDNERVKEAQDVFDGKVELAEDLMEVEI